MNNYHLIAETESDNESVSNRDDFIEEFPDTESDENSSGESDQEDRRQEIEHDILHREFYLRKDSFKMAP